MSAEQIKTAVFNGVRAARLGEPTNPYNLSNQQVQHVAWATGYAEAMREFAAAAGRAITRAEELLLK